MKCPICQKEDLGRITKSRYFCDHCFIEILHNKKSKFQVFKILEDGSTSPIKVEMQKLNFVEA